MSCPTCGATNPEEANFCIRCGAQLKGSRRNRPPRRGRFIGPVVLFLLVLIAGAAAVAAFLHGSHHTPHPVAAATTTLSPGPTASPTPPPSFSFTDPNTQVMARVDSPKVDRTGNAGQVPSSGKEFVAVPVMLHNGGKSLAIYFGLDFSAYDQKDNQYRRVETSQYPRADGTYIGFGAMTKGQTRSGVVVFELPLNTKLVTIKWDDDKKMNPPRTMGTFDLS